MSASVTLFEETLVMSQWILILSAILLNVCGHLFLKAGMNRIGAISLDQLVFSFTKIFSTPFVLLGLFSYVSSVAMYMVVLSKDIFKINPEEIPGLKVEATILGGRVVYGMR